MSEYELTAERYGATNPDKTVVEVCTVCGFPFQTSEMRKYKGKWYCKPNTCADDIQGMRDEGKRRR